MGVSHKIIVGASTTKGKPTIKEGPSQTAKIVTPKKTGKSGRGD